MYVTAGLLMFLALLFVGFLLIAWNCYRLQPKPKATCTAKPAVILLQPAPRIDIRV